MMKTIGLIGGMSWESSAEYYRLINEAVQDRLGGVHSAKIIMYSVDFAEIEKVQRTGDWEGATQLMIDVARRIERSGADFLLICTNTMHQMYDEVRQAISIPVSHIANPVGEAIKQNGLSKVGLLGTRFTMEGTFYQDRLKERFNTDIIIPNTSDREVVHRIIYDELVIGKIRDESRQKYLEVIQRLKDSGAEGVILGCTEIPLLIKQEDVAIPVFDTTTLHAMKAVELALEGEEL